MRIRSLLIACALLGALPASAATGPRLSVANLSDISVPDRPYDENADADAAVANALARAKAEHKRLMIDLGGNWCADCRILSGVMAIPEVRHLLDTHYVVVLVDVGRFNRNLQIPARFGITQRLEGVPSVLITDASGKLVDAGHIAALADARSMTPQAIADWLAQWTS